MRLDPTYSLKRNGDLLLKRIDFKLISYQMMMEKKSGFKRMKSTLTAAKRERIRKLYEEKGGGYEDVTKEKIGQTSMLFFSSPRQEPSDAAETCLRNLNRRKPKDQSK